MAHTRSVASTGIPFIDSLLSGTAWSGRVTVAVMDEAPGGAYGGTGVATPPKALADAVRKALAMIERYCDIELNEPGRGETADIRIFMADSLTIDGKPVALGGYAFFPGPTEVAGDVWIGTNRAGDIEPGRLGYHTLLHEIGHALGLRHPHEAGASGAAHRDGSEWSVMSGRSEPGSGLGMTAEPDGYSETFMSSDIAALQQIYGANHDDRTNDTYVFLPRERVMMRSVWDGGGRDTYDFSAYANDLRVDLAPGGWSTTGQEAHLNRTATVMTGETPLYARGSVHNAHLFEGDRRSLIENATAGSGDDRVGGNAAQNVLRGGAGADTLLGLGGNDRLCGQGGDDVLVGGIGNDTLEGGAGRDRASGAAGRDNLSGGAGDDILLGGAGRDTIRGGPGDDVVRAGGGGGRVAGDAGDDTLVGGAGRDRIAGGGGDDRVVGGAGTDRLIGGAGDDTLVAGEGGDVITGGGGRDVFVFAGADGEHVIVDFRPGTDLVDVPDPHAAFASAQEGRGEVIIVVGAGTVTLLGLLVSELAADDFL